MKKANGNYIYGGFSLFLGLAAFIYFMIRGFTASDVSAINSVFDYLTVYIGCIFASVLAVMISGIGLIINSNNKLCYSGIIFNMFAIMCYAFFYI